MLVKDLARLLERRADRDRDEVLLRHPLGDREVEPRLESEVAIREDADQFAVRVGDGNAADLVLLHDRHRLGDRLPRPHGDRVDDHAGLGTLHLVHFFGLPVDRHVLVDDAEAAVLRHRDGEPRLGDRVHRRGKDRDVEVDVARQARRDVDEVRVQLRLRRFQQDVVERERDGRPFGKTRRRKGVALHDLMQLDAADDGDLIA